MTQIDDRPPQPHQGCLVVVTLGGLLLSFTCIGSGFALWWFNRPEPVDVSAVRASNPRLTMAENDLPLTVVRSNTRPEVYFRVDLEDVPTDVSLDLVATWIDPSGSIAHERGYTTQPVERTPWPTHARYRFTPRSPQGQWTVTLALADGHELARLQFEVRP